jgi:hypothetical protein
MAVLVAAAPLVPATAVADMTKAQCVDANTAAQDLRREGKLTAAREQLLKCADPSCPGIVRDDCAKRLDELNMAQPTIAFEVKDASGADVFAVSVTLDGRPWAGSLEGKALPADPGKHVFVFTTAGHVPVARTVVLTEGEKGRRERIVLEGPGAAPAAPGVPLAVPNAATASTPGAAPVGSAGTDAAPSPARGLGAQKVLGLVVGGVGAAGLGLGAIFGTMTLSAWSNAKSACGGNPSACTHVASGESYRSQAEGDATVSTVGFIAGGVLLAVGAAIFVTGRSPQTAATTGLVVLPSAGPTGAGLAMRGSF